MYPIRKAWKQGSFLTPPTGRGSRLGLPLLILFALLLGTAFSAHAATVMCSDFGGVVDGSNPATFAAIQSASSFGIDMNCTIKNFPESVGGFPITNINFNFPQQQSYYIAFLDVFYYGHMSCNDPTQSDFWIYWAPGGFNDISPSCQAFMVPVDAVRKTNPPSQTTAVVGVPFTYTITVPLMGKLDPTGVFQYIANADDTTITNAVITDDLTATGAALTYVTNTAWLVNPGTGARTPLNGGLPLALGASGAWLANHPGILSDTTKHLVFSYEYNPDLASIAAGYNIEIDLTVVLDSSPAGVNAAQTQFSNTARMWFDKTINTTNMVDLQAQFGTTPPMTIVEPNLAVTKTSSMSNLNVGTQAPYTINVQNNGGNDAWNAVIADNIPAGMCTFDPRPTVTARIFAADGVTPVSSPLIEGTDFSVSWNGGTASACQLSLQMLTAAAKIGPTQRLIINYMAMLDAGTSSGTFTNVAGATQWFSAASGYAGRREYDRTLTNGTPGVLDYQDAYTITAAVAGYYFLKSVDDLTTGASPAAVAFPGDRLRYTLQIQNFNIPPLNNITVSDDLGALNGFTAFVPGSLSLAGTNLPAGTYAVCSTCGTNGAGTVSISGLTLGSNVQYQIQFDVTLAAGIANGAVVRNQASLSGVDSNNTAWSGVSDAPFVNGPAMLGTPSDITPVLIQAPQALSKASPNPGTATIGQQFSYIVTVPAAAASMPLYDVRILDTLPPNVSFVSAQVVSGGSWNLSNTGTATNLVLQDTNTGIDIPAGGQAVIRITVAVQNSATNTSGVSFTNSASYTYNKLNGGGISTQGTGGAGVSAPMSVVEPHLTVTKTMSYVQPAGKPAANPAAPGDVLLYTVTIPNSGNSTAFDTDVVDTLPANVSLVPGSATATMGGAPVTGFIVNPTALPSGALAWGRQNGDESLDIPAGQSLVLTYRVTVLSVSGTPATNSVYVDWTSLNDDITGERTGAGCPAITSPNNYCSGPATTTVPTLDPTALAKSVVSDSWNPGNDSILRIGDTVVYSLALTLREGVTQNVVVSDTLPAGLAFAGPVSITPASGGNFIYTVASQPPPGATGTLTWSLGNITNAIDNNPANNALVIQYRARVVKNTLPQTPTAQTLTNNATLNYAINGVAAPPKTSGATISVLKPMLGVSKSAAPAAGGTVIFANEIITYTVNIQNTGNAPAYNTVLQDVIPAGMRSGAGAVTMVSISLVNAGTTLPNLAPAYSPATGVAVWNFDSGIANQYAIPAGDTLRIVYRVQADPTLGAGMTLVNAAQVQHYYSFDSQAVPVGSVATDRQDFGTTSVATVQLTTASALALSKQNLVSTAAIGQPFTYRITIPTTPQPTAMYDVRVLDNLSLALTGVNMSFVSVQRVSGPAFTPVNTGTATNPVIQDTTTGIDIPAGQQAVLDVTLVLNDDIVNNNSGKLFQNTATYTYNSVNNNSVTAANGAPGTSGAITIIGPNLTMQKSGPGGMRIGIPGVYRLNVQNIGTATAWNTTVTDILPSVASPAAGGMCGSAPTNVVVRIYQADGVTPVSAPLASGTDYTVTFAGAPACTWTIALKSPAAAIPPSDRLIVTYSASLDPGTASNLALTNVAGATQWQSADPAVPGASGSVHTFANALTNGTPGVSDYQDAFTTTTESPVLTFTKTVYNVTTGQSGAVARPGDTLKYTLTIQNVSTVNAANFSLTDELDRLNASALFVPGSLTLITVPAGADTALTSAIGGTKGTGLVNIGNLSIGPQGGANDRLVIEFQARLVPVITSGSAVLNQAQIGAATLPTQSSDDPSIAGTGDPTRTLITSAPAFRVLKTVQDITSGTSIVMAGDTLRYTITVKNIGSENAAGVTLRDQIPANTSYVAGSTRLNGAVAADPGAGVSALQNGMPINSPADPTAGAMPADAGATAANVATVTFDVKISATVVNGAIISNQGFVNGSGRGSGPFPEQPSDNPATPVLNDPTSVVVGNLPLVSALKTVLLVVDNNNNGNLDPGDVLQYTITLTNSGPTQATGVVLTDAIPANTAFVAGSVTMNGAAVADPGAGVSPLTNGLGVVSSGLTPPSPSSSGGTLAAGGTGIVTFKVQVNAGVPSGTVISNQGSVATAEVPTLLTDADGNPTNGFQPTVITVGNAQMLTVTKQVAVVGGGTAVVGAELEYTVRVTNIGTAAATSVVITDVLPGQLSFVPGSALLNGSSTGISVAGPVITADYSSVYGGLPANGTIVLRFHAKIMSGTVGTTLTNTAQVTWNTPSQNASGSVSVDIGGSPGSASLNGLVWHDVNFNKICDSSERDLTGWTVQVLRNSQLLKSVLTDTSGSYAFSGLAPTTSADRYEIRFSAPGAGPATAMLGLADSPFTNGPQRISGITAASGSNLRNLNLPIDPAGVIYDSVLRTPVAGAVVTMVRASTNGPLPATCFDDPAQQNQVTSTDGFYKFDLNFGDASCPAGDTYLIAVTPPGGGYVAAPSQIIPPTGTVASPFSVPSCLGGVDDAIPTTADYCEVTASASVPPTSVLPRTNGTTYHVYLKLSNGRVPGQSQLFNNHIPVDPVLNGAVAITKTASMINVTKGQLVPYTITVKNVFNAPLFDLIILDRFPAGFKYVAGSARLDGSPREPRLSGRELLWDNIVLQFNESRTLQLLLVVGAGVSEGEYVNRAQVLNSATGGSVSGEATATVRVIPDPTFDCTDVIGKVFDDRNLNGRQDPGEQGLPGVRVVTARGLISTSDEYGRFHITCAAVPDGDRGSNFILKLDERSLPTGYRMTTENPLVERATRGKMLRFNFGATIHRVVRIDIADGAFEPDTDEVRMQWNDKIGQLLEELKKGPSVLRLSYLADVEDRSIVQKRLEALKKEIVKQWDQAGGGYRLDIETEIFWRRGNPPAVQ